LPQHWGENSISEVKRLNLTLVIVVESRAITRFDPETGINEMVRRRVGFGSAVLHQEDHHMHIASIGIDLGKTTFHLVALGERNFDGSCSTGWYAGTAAECRFYGLNQ
jgi:hypothetical protein